MHFNYLRLAKISTNLTLLTFLIFALGLIFATADSVLDWDILPDLIERYAQLILTTFGIFVSLFIITSVVCSITTIAEATAWQHHIQQQPETKLSPRKRLTIGIIIIAIIIVFLGFQKIDSYRKHQLFTQKVEKFTQRLTHQAQELEQALIKVLATFPQPLLQRIEDRTILEDTDALKEFLVAVSLSISKQPQVLLLMKARDPYRYWMISVTPDYNPSNIIQYKLHQQPYIRFARDLENQIVEYLFKGRFKPLTQPLNGNFINNTEPSSWGVLTLADQVVALITLKNNINSHLINELRSKSTFFHPGPAQIHSNLSAAS